MKNSLKIKIALILGVVALIGLVFGIRNTLAAETYNVVVNFLFPDNSLVTDPFTAQVDAGGDFVTQLTLPTIQGYDPYVEDDATPSATLDINFTDIQENKIINVFYRPAQVTYTVEHYWQNVENDEYTLHESETLTGYTKDTPTGIEKTYNGFYALYYESPELAADGSTIIRLYYDRYNYLAQYNLDGGVGVDPLYEKYGAPLNPGTPMKPGYVFAGWSPSVPATMPAGGGTYTAQWTPGGANYTVLFLYENVDNNSYSTVASYTASAIAGTNVSSGTYQNTNFTGRDDDHFTYNSSLAQTVTVSGDGSTTLCVYFTRNVLTFRFTSNNQTYLEISGKYQASFAQYGYSWPSEKRWYIGSLNSTMTFLGAFAPSELMEGEKNGNVYPFRENTTTVSGAHMYFYTQQLDGSYKYDLTPYADYADAYAVIGSTSTFTVSEKFPGFHAQAYRVYSNSPTTEVYYTYNGEEYTGARYVVTTDNPYPVYGVVDGQFVSLVRVAHTNFSSTTATSGTLYGLVDGDYVRIYPFNYNYTRYTGTQSTRSRYYWNGSGFSYATVYYNNGHYYLSRNPYDNEIIPYSRSYSTTRYYYGISESGVPGAAQYTGTRYTTSVSYTYEYNGVPYTGTKYEPSTGTNAGTTYYGVVNGQLVALTRDTRQSNWGPWTNISSGGTIPSSSYDRQLRFERDIYTLYFYNFDSFDTANQSSVLYQASLAPYNYVPAYPEGLDYGKYTFAGWYDNDQLAGEPFDFSTASMPVNNMTLFSKWQPKTFTVNVYTNVNDAISGTNLLETHTVNYNDYCPTPVVPASDYTFIGWFYEDSHGEEHPFSFAAMPINNNMNVYGKWISNTLVPYTIYFQLADGTDIADPISSYALDGSSRTFYASTDFYSGYETGYFPGISSHTTTFDASVNNDYTFVYYYFVSVPYTVRYLDARTEEPLLPDKTVVDNQEPSVTERFVVINEYVPDRFQKSIILSANDASRNVITFYYTKDAQHAYYLTTHYIEQPDGGYTVYNALDTFANIGATVTASPITISGYTYDSTVTGTVTSGTVSSSGLELKLYYKLNTYPYIVRYLNQNTNAVLATQKSGTAKYKTTVTENYIAIAGYRISGATEKSIVMDIDTVGNVIHNVITFYYIINDATINYTVTPVGGGTVTRTSEHLNPETSLAQGTTATPTAGWVFVGWFANAAGTTPISGTVATISGNTIIPQKYDNGNGQTIYHDDTFYAIFRKLEGNLTISKSVNGIADYPNNFTFQLTLSNMNNDTITTTGNIGSLTFVNGTATFNLKDTQSVTISNIPAGVTYSLTETDYTADGFRTTIDVPTGTIVDQTTTTVNVINTFVSVVAPMGNDNHRILTASIIILGVGLVLATTGYVIKKRFFR